MVACRLPSRHRALTALWCLAALLALGWFTKANPRDVPLTAEERQLYDWVQEDTPTDALFVIPPGMQTFRYYSLRSAYIDFKFFPTAEPAVLPQWRERLEQVAAPDKLALTGRGIPAAAEWDRTYANRNTPQRIAELLAETGADYFLWDRDGLKHAPYVAVERPDDPRVAVCFENDRFCVYRRTKENP